MMSSIIWRHRAHRPVNGANSSARPADAITLRLIMPTPGGWPHLNSIYAVTPEAGAKIARHYMRAFGANE